MWILLSRSSWLLLLFLRLFLLRFLFLILFLLLLFLYFGLLLFKIFLLISCPSDCCHVVDINFDPLSIFTHCRFVKIFLQNCWMFFLILFLLIGIDWLPSWTEQIVKALRKFLRIMKTKHSSCSSNQDY